MGRQVRKINGQNKTVVMPDFPTSLPSFSQEEWDKIFPGNKEFESKYGKIYKCRIRQSYEEYEYVDKDDGQYKTIQFARGSKNPNCAKCVA